MKDKRLRSLGRRSRLKGEGAFSSGWVGIDKKLRAAHSLYM